MRRLTVILVAGAVTAALGSGPLHGAGEQPCQQATLSASYTNRVVVALRSGRDLWGNRLLATRNGPTYKAARMYLAPLLLARAPRGRPLTDSGVYYVPFAQPLGAEGARSVALHVADGSQVISQRVGGTTLTIGVGRDGNERYGSCVSRLETPRLLEGYLPIMDVAYVDRAGVGYRQQSFAGRIPQTRSLVSFVSVTADTRRADATAQIRFTPSVGLTLEGSRLVRRESTYLLFSSGGAFDGGSLRYDVEPKSVRTVYAAWLNEPTAISELTLTSSVYETALRSTAEYWKRRLSAGATFVVPEPRVLDAERNLLVQNLALTWRYSIGNPYEEFSFPESVDVAQVMAGYGFLDIARAILLTSLQRRPVPYPNWKMGEKLLASALYYRLFEDKAYIEEVTPVLSGYVDVLGRQITADRRGILQRERYSSDIPDSVYGLHSQAAAWQGLRSMGQVWARTGERGLAARCRALAAKLETGLRHAVRISQKRLPDGSLFVPVRLLDPEQPYEALTASRGGSYWNLVMPYALASGLFAPGSPETRGVFAYMSRHGSRLLGLVRAAAFALYGTPVYPTSGTDQVYGINAARFLADNDRPDQLVLSLYGHLAAGMTQDTFISGEAASIAPLANGYYRSMYLPPNSASNAALLETLRLMLVHETRRADGAPSGLELAYATPRAWLRPGQRILVRGAPTSFGRISYSIESGESSVRVELDVPARARPQRLSLRLRLPRGSRMTKVISGRRPFPRVDLDAETIDLSGRSGRIALVVGVVRASAGRSPGSS